MATNTYFGVGNVAKKIKSVYVGVGNVAKKVKKAYVGVNGVAKLVYTSAADTLNSLFIAGGSVSTPYLTKLRNDIPPEYLVDNGYLRDGTILTNVEVEQSFYKTLLFGFQGSVEFDGLDLSSWVNDYINIQHNSGNLIGFSVEFFDANGSLLAKRQTPTSSTPSQVISVQFGDVKASTRSIKVTFNYRGSTSTTGVSVLAISNVAV